MTKDDAFEKWSEGLWEALPSNETEVFRGDGLRLIIFALRSAYRAGQEDMRERAAEAAYWDGRDIDDPTGNVADTVRALPLEGDDETA